MNDYEAGYKAGLAEGGRICEAIANKRIAVLEAQLADIKNQLQMQIELARKEERQRIMAILKTAYPAIDTWPCWADIRG